MASEESSEEVAAKPPAPIPGSKKRKPLTKEQKVKIEFSMKIF